MTKLKYIDSEEKPEGVRETLFRDFISGFKKIVIHYPKVKDRIPLLKRGKLWIYLEGMKYRIVYKMKDEILYLEPMDEKNRTLSLTLKDPILKNVKMSRGVPLVDMMDLQLKLDEQTVSEILEE